MIVKKWDVLMMVIIIISKMSSEQCSDPSANPVFMWYEIINIFFNAPFIVGFLNRCYILHSLSSSDKFKRYYPIPRVILAIVYISISTAILIINIAKNIFPYKWINYILGGGGGACINSLVLLLQLIVLRYQLLKEQPYTPLHFLFFMLLAVTSIIRLFFCYFYHCITNTPAFILANILGAVAILQLIFWAAKRQSLPQFIDHDEIDIKEILNPEIFHHQFLSSKKELFEIQGSFPYLIPFVTVQNGQIKMILEVSKEKWELNLQQEEEVSKDKKNGSGTKLQGDRKKSENPLKRIVETSFSQKQVHELYVLGHRFPIKKELDIESLPLPELAKELQVFLEEVLMDKKHYQPDLLNTLKMPLRQIKLYQQFCQKKRSSIQMGKDFDPKIGRRLPEDKNAIYCSVNIFGHLWTSNHYEFYIRASFPSIDATTYPIKRYSEFQQFHNGLKNIIKTLGLNLQLPSLPKKHMFQWSDSQQQILGRRVALERYLRCLSNDYTLMVVPEIKAKILTFLKVQSSSKILPKFQIQFYQQLQIFKGEVTKILVRNKLVTFYDFRLFCSGVETRVISKRYSDFDELHQELQRWMHNIGITYNFVVMPEKIMFKSTAVRHQKLKKYLYHVIQIEDIGKVYSVNAFLNVRGNEDQRISDISAIQALDLSKKSVNQSSFNAMIELQKKLTHSSKHDTPDNFDKIIDDLGNQNLD